MGWYPRRPNRRRLANYFTDYAPMPSELVEADQAGGLLRQNRELLLLELRRRELGEEEAGRLLGRIYARPPPS